MREILKPGHVLHHKDLGSIRILSFLGSGGQGEVYKVQCKDQELALKWYFPNHCTDNQKQLIDRLCRIGPPNGNFLWPMYRVDDPLRKGFGYLMPLRPERYRSIVDLMKRRVDPSFHVLTRAAILVTDGFKRLHDRGFCYRDISFGNIFFDPENGEVLICDNDNIAYEQESTTAVLGTPRFMAPEIVTGQSVPTVSSDLYSLSVLLFYLFFVHHPLEGKRESEIKCFDLPAMNRLYGTDPLFIFDPMNPDNRPLRQFHGNAMIYWGIYPEFFKDLFTHAFTGGLKKPEHRIPEAEWLRGLEKLMLSIQHCPCGAENFYDIQRLRKPESVNRCWSCNKEMQMPLRMRIRDEVVVLSRSTPLYTHLFQPGNRDFRKVYGAVAQNPKHGGGLLLQNLSSETWEIETGDGKTILLEAGKSHPLTHGQRIRFGGFLEAEVRQ